MIRDKILPQGRYKVGRDISSGIYLFASLNDLSFVNIEREKDLNTNCTLNDENTKMCHLELKVGEILVIDGRVKVRQITSSLENNSNVNLINEIENFQTSLGVKDKKSYRVQVESLDEDEDEEDDYEEDEDEDDTFEEDEDIDDEDYYEEEEPKSSVGFFSILADALGGSSTSSKKHSGRCDGDCANCPPHYGYRYGRWYYGHGHNHGCERGGNKGGGGPD